jgi:2-aminobenzoate-CoA ligase
MIDTFARDNLPPAALWPDLDLSHPAYQYPDMMNCTTRFLDHWVARGGGDATAIYSPFGNWSYATLAARVNQIAHVLVEDMGLIPGNRVLLRSANNPMMVAIYMAVMRAGGIAVGTMPLLRASELVVIIDKAEISHALCDIRLQNELDIAENRSEFLKQIKYFDASSENELEVHMASKPNVFDPYESRADDVCLIAFTSGTTGKAKGTMHFHRDLLAVCDGFCSHVIDPNPDDIFCGSPPLAFTFGLGGLALFPLHTGAATVLVETTTPVDLLDVIEDYRATILFTAPTAYRAMTPLLGDRDISSLRRGISAGEHLPKATYEAFLDASGLRLFDGIGSTEMLHTMISSSETGLVPGSTGTMVPGFQGKIVDDDGNDLPAGTVGRLAVKGPTGCRYLADDRQTNYVQDGWNLTGDTFLMDENGYFWYQARADDMIISAGYNIAGPEVENALLEHAAVGECAVVGKPDDLRGSIVKAFVVPGPGIKPSDTLAKSLQDHAKEAIAPYKYPREIEFVNSLPKTQTGKLQRFKLRLDG